MTDAGGWSIEPDEVDLGWLADLDLGTPVDGDTLTYDEGTNTWTTGRGLPQGGKRHEVLRKVSEADGATAWEVVAPFGPLPPQRQHGVGDLWIESGVAYLED